MTSTSQLIDTPWQLTDDIGSLQMPKLNAVIDVGHPVAGLRGFSFAQSEPINGFVLGINTEEQALGSSAKEVVVRGNDLIARYAETKQRPFACEVYWRALADANDATILDAIISVQTDLLESFPQFSVRSQLVAEEVWHVGADGTEEQLTSDQQFTEDSGCVVLRIANSAWSYAEMTHPDDHGTWNIKRVANGVTSVHRQLGGAFLEKGVIRRLRVRGAFVPRVNDLKAATECLATLAAEAPPLTT